MLTEPEIKTGVDPDLMKLLVCPLTKTVLEYDAQMGELVSRAAGLAFPLRNGVPILLLQEARKIDADD